MNARVGGDYPEHMVVDHTRMLPSHEVGRCISRRDR